MPRCVHCQIDTRRGFTTDSYTREGADIQVTVSGIPANICPSCGESYVDTDTAEEIEQLVLPFFEAARAPRRLPTPEVTVAFPSLVPVAAA